MRNGRRFAAAALDPERGARESAGSDGDEGEQPAARARGLVSRRCVACRTRAVTAMGHDSALVFRGEVCDVHVAPSVVGASLLAVEDEHHVQAGRGLLRDAKPRTTDRLARWPGENRARWDVGSVGACEVDRCDPEIGGTRVEDDAVGGIGGPRLVLVASGTAHAHRAAGLGDRGRQAAARPVSRTGLDRQHHVDRQCDRHRQRP